MTPSTILSVSLCGAEKKSPSRRYLLTQFHSLIHTSLTAEQRRLFAADIARMETSILEMVDTRRLRGIIFFSAGAQDWAVVRTDVPLPVGCRIAQDRWQEPLVGALAHYEPYAVLVVDREKGRLFTARHGRMAEHVQVYDAHVPTDAKTTSIYGNRSDLEFGAHQRRLKEHFRLIGEVAAGFTKGKRIDLLLVGGHHEHVSLMVSLLPAPLRRLVRGTFDADLHAPLSDLFWQSMSLVDQVHDLEETHRYQHALHNHNPLFHAPLIVR